jgi:DNA-directed RNA polymerase specialized sigma24 family protein
MAPVGLPADRLSDQALLLGFRGHSAEAGVAFVRRFQRHVCGCGTGGGGRPDLAEDVAQQTFERAWGRAACFDPAWGTVKTWLATIAHNLAVDALPAGKLMPLDPSDLVRLFASRGSNRRPARAN